MPEITFVSFKDAVALLPDHHEHPLWRRPVVEKWLSLFQPYSDVFGVIRMYLEDYYASEVCLVDGLPYMCQHNNYLGRASSWLLDCMYCCGPVPDQDHLKLANQSAAKKWAVSTDIPAVLGKPGFLTSHVCDPYAKYPAKKANEQRQALALHTNARLSPVESIPFDYLCANLDYWLDQGSCIESTLAAALWAEASQDGYSYEFTSDKGHAYVALVDSGRNHLTLNNFFQHPSNRTSRTGTAALCLVRDELVRKGFDGKWFLTTPKFEEDTAYEVYKKHLSTGTESVWSDFCFNSTVSVNGPHYLQSPTGGVWK